MEGKVGTPLTVMTDAVSLMVLSWKPCSAQLAGTAYDTHGHNEHSCKMRTT
jgi:hypothetical protein